MAVAIVKAKRDQDFRDCYPDWFKGACVLGALTYFSISVDFWETPRSNTVVSICLPLIMIALSQFYLSKLIKTFRPIRIEGGSDETDFTFGQAFGERRIGRLFQLVDRGYTFRVVGGSFAFHMVSEFVE
ncbi:hypothetical protein ABW20_dc0110427 [Dactylellina cionopaga]|nr:hypothetical protein ABW20_dc0110427 [Dactylellina cionopaga]